MKSPSQQHGVALLLVLWVIALMATIATVLLRQVAQSSDNGRFMEQRLHASIHTGNCLNALALTLQRGTLERQANNTALNIELFDEQCEIDLSFEETRLDLNFTEREQLSTLFTKLDIASSLPSADAFRHKPLYLSIHDAAQSLELSVDDTKSLEAYTTVFTRSALPQFLQGTTKDAARRRITGEIVRLLMHPPTGPKSATVIARFTGKAGDPIQAASLNRYH